MRSYFPGASTLPRTQNQAQGRSGEMEGRTQQANQQHAQQQHAQQQQAEQQQRQLQQQQQQTSVYDTVSSRRGMDTYGTRGSRGPPSHHASQASLHNKAGTLTRGGKDESVTVNGRGGDNRSLRGSRRELSSKSVDYTEMANARDADTLRRRPRSKSTDDVNKGERDIYNSNIDLDSSTLKRMLKPIPSGAASSCGSPEAWRRRGDRGRRGRGVLARGGSTVSYPEGITIQDFENDHRMTPARSAMSVLGMPEGDMLFAHRGYQLDMADSPPSDHQFFDVGCYATTPSSSRRPRTAAASPNTSSLSLVASTGQAAPSLMGCSLKATKL